MLCLIEMACRFRRLCRSTPLYKATDSSCIALRANGPVGLHPLSFAPTGTTLQYLAGGLPVHDPVVGGRDQS